MAMAYYNKVVDYLQYDSDFTDEAEKARRRNVLLASHLNLALCHMKLGEHTSCISECDKALEINPKSEKAFFRTGQAHMAMNNYDEAKTAFLKALEVDPDNKAARNQITLCQQKIKELREQEKTLYKSIFNKMLKPSKDSPTPAGESNGATKTEETEADSEPEKA